MNPYVRVVAQRPSADELWECREWTVNPIKLELDPELAYDDDWHLGPQLSRHGDLTSYALIWSQENTGDYVSIIEIRDGERRPGDQGSCEHGAIVDLSQWYEYGTDLVTLAASGFRFGWTAAQWLHAALRLDLLDHHANRQIHGRLRAKRIRLALLDATPDHRSFSKRADELDVFPPVLFLDSHAQAGTDAQRAAELATLAAAIAAFTQHPDPRIDALLHDPPGRDVLRDLLLERTAPVDPLLADLLGLPAGPLPDDDTVDPDLRALWQRVMELDPLIQPPAEWDGPF
jgi:hypothetical protein